ncbi:hypothetical protein PF003_g40233 [Phytophthora fragariae]|nr:hypothetical protein PF003_g40233 [Phytophthora fragariae]
MCAPISIGFTWILLPSIHAEELSAKRQAQCSRVTECHRRRHLLCLPFTTPASSQKRSGTPLGMHHHCLRARSNVSSGSVAAGNTARSTSTT